MFDDAIFDSAIFDTGLDTTDIKNRRRRRTSGTDYQYALITGTLGKRR